MITRAMILLAQVTTPPTLAPPPGLKMPAVQEARLPNGLRLVVVPMHIGS